MLNRKRQQGFSVIELVLVVAIIGIVASIMIPNLIDSLQKAKQRRTMAELRLIGGAWMSWFTDQAGAASAGANQIYEVDNHRVVTYPEIYGYLHPSDTFFYMQDVPNKDAWGSDLTFYMNEDPGADNQLMLCAAARDNIYDTCTGDDIPIGPFLATDFDQDIVWADGAFLRYPNI